MIIIGERLNSSRKAIAQAIAEKNKKFLQQEAHLQAENSACFIDVNCAMSMEQEIEDMRWLVSTVQEKVDLPLCIDSPNPAAIEAGLKIHKGEALVNSITAEVKRMREILPLVKKYNAQVIALTMDEDGMPSGVAARVKLVEKIIGEAENFGIDKNRILFDPLVRPVSTEPQQAQVVLEAIREIKKMGCRTVCGLSNISFGLPKRTVINSSMLTLAIYQGLDAAIIDPLDNNIMQAILATEALVNKDEYCLNFIKACRNKKI